MSYRLRNLNSVNPNPKKMKTFFTLASKVSLAVSILSFSVNATVAQSNSAFKAFGIKAASLHTPVKYTSFNAQVSEKKVILDWNTEMDITTSHYEVERSYDNINFSTIGLVLDALTASEDSKNYKFKDLTVTKEPKPVVYYRIKQIDNNGSTTYSNVLVIKFQAAKKGILQTEPNPFTDKIVIPFESVESGRGEIRFIDITGQKVISRQFNVMKGSNNILVNGLAQLGRGIYLAQLLIDGIVIDSQKVIKN